MGKGRPALGSPAFRLSPVLQFPDPEKVPEPEAARRIRNQAKTRALTVVRNIFIREFTKIYLKELEHLSDKHALNKKKEDA